jgi:hypothetical protein
MATVAELIEQYDHDPELQKEIDDILADGKITIDEFKSFKKHHDLDVPITELPKIIKEAKKLGLL